MFDYEVMTEEQAMAERFQLIKEGEYDAVVTSSMDKISSSGNPMMDMTVTVYDENGKTHDIRDFLVFTKAMMWKVVHFVKSARILKEYESGKLCSTAVINKRVRVKIVTEAGKEIPFDKLNGRIEGSRFPDKNKIEDYLSLEGKVNTLSGKDPIDEDVPF